MTPIERVKYLEELRKRAVRIINTDWLYSMHWGKHPKERHWTMDAKHDCFGRISACEEDLKNLKGLYKELEEECKYHYPETEEEKK